jgi:CheY-like chemotaxis protein
VDANKNKHSKPVVLVVEDEWLVRTVIVNYLETNGCRVLEAGSGEEAVSLIDGKDQQLDVLFTDRRQFERVGHRRDFSGPSSEHPRALRLGLFH